MSHNDDDSVLDFKFDHEMTPEELEKEASWKTAKDELDYVGSQKEPAKQTVNEVEGEKCGVVDASKEPINGNIIAKSNSELNADCITISQASMSLMTLASNYVDKANANTGNSSLTADPTKH